jgi:membrane protein implicated in regulation of membrane protease activity
MKDFMFDLKSLAYGLGVVMFPTTGMGSVVLVRVSSMVLLVEVICAAMVVLTAGIILVVVGVVVCDMTFKLKRNYFCELALVNLVLKMKQTGRRENERNEPEKV